MVEGNLLSVSNVLENVEGVVDHLRTQTRNITGGTSQSGRRRQITERATNMVQLNKFKEGLVKAKQELTKVQVGY